MAADDTGSFTKRLSKALAGRGADDQKFLLAALLNDALPAGASAVVVGGSLVQLYTMGAVTSLDLDLVADRRTVKRILEDAGFVEGPLSMWRHPDHAPLVNVVSDALGPHEQADVVEFEGLAIPVASLEDCIVDRLAGAEHWDDATDRERVVTLLRIHHERLDMARLRKRARQERVEALLDRLLDIAR